MKTGQAERSDRHPSSNPVSSWVRFVPSFSQPVPVRWFAVCLLFALVWSSSACKDPNQSSLESDRHPSLFFNIQRKEIAIDTIGLTLNPTQTIYGRFLDLKLRNLTNRPIPITIEPGTVLRSDNQKLFTNLVITAGENLTLNPGETKIQTIEVFSINFYKLTPVRETQFSLGNLIGGDTSTFIQCFVQRRPDRIDPTALPPGVVRVPTKPGEPPTYIIPPREKMPKVEDPTEKKELAPVQLAIWRITDDMDRVKLLKSVSANPKLKGGQFSESAAFYDSQTPYVQQLLRDCGLEKYKF